MKNSTGHIILRSTKQWTSLLGDSLGSTLACNARNRVFRSPASLTNSFESFVENLQNIKCPSFQPGEDSFSKQEHLLPDAMLQVLLNTIASVNWDDISQSVSKFQWLDESLGLGARDGLWWHKFCGGMWDKKAHRNHAVCRVLDDIRTCDGILFGKGFTLAGWGPTPRDAQATTLIQLLDSANECGVLGDIDAFRRLLPNLTPDNVVPFVNRPFESGIHGTVNFTQFCCVLLVTWCYRVLLSCYLRPK